MKKWIPDHRFIIGFLIAHLLLFFSYEDKAVFWYIFTGTMLVLISYAILHEEMDDKLPTGTYLFYGTLSGAALFGVFWAGSSVIDLLNLPMQDQIDTLYREYAPSMLWQYVILILIIAPGEEIFWRGFIQKRLLKHTNAWTSIIVSTLMYTSVHFYSGHLALPLAALAAGLVWSSLYAWKRSIPLVIISHIVFDLLLFLFIPLR
ncbi:CPBP family intramembrane glutamic endopeptidase [Mesobacillus harenae]|uniref:CPBP family intramembrane glutamic endopeptidase n=1 Tax=Mesobacillus harenae TaxID=2213203 RepID=UPI001580014D|nr:type II CAAX endopeptidase family protein [Mesobacillus harenae]